jgi:hypothetical protein
MELGQNIYETSQNLPSARWEVLEQWVFYMGFRTLVLEISVSL